MTKRNDLSIYSDLGWWSGDRRDLRLLRNLVPARLAHFERVVSSWHGLQVVDVGCGGGFMAEALTVRGARVIGIDPDAQALEAARAHARAAGLAIDYRLGFGEELPVEDGVADAVVCVDVLEHVVSVPSVLAEIARVLRPGGVLLFDTISRTRWARLVLVLLAEHVLHFVPRGTHDPNLFLNPHELKAHLRSQGLRAGRFVGLGPVGINRHGDVVFGRLPSTALMYMGHAVREPS